MYAGVVHYAVKYYRYATIQVYNNISPSKIEKNLNANKVTDLGWLIVKILQGKLKKPFIKYVQ